MLYENVTSCILNALKPDLVCLICLNSNIIFCLWWKVTVIERLCIVLIPFSKHTKHFFIYIVHRTFFFSLKCCSKCSENFQMEHSINVFANRKLHTKHLKNWKFRESENIQKYSLHNLMGTKTFLEHFVSWDVARWIIWELCKTIYCLFDIKYSHYIWIPN